MKFLSTVRNFSSVLSWIKFLADLFNDDDVTAGVIKLRDFNVD
jgi:hypothetical protein